MGDLSVRCSSKPTGATGAPLLIVRDESHRLSLGGLLSSRARLRFTSRIYRAMKKFRLEQVSAANGDLWVNWLSQPRGPVQRDPVMTDVTRP